jgi:hypothetical protein
MSKGAPYLERFGSDPLKRLHGCAIAEVGRGAESPCHGLARSERRPQIGFGNPTAPILFLSPSPLDPASASNKAFGEWLEREALLQHHFISERVTPYFRFVRAVLIAARQRWDQQPHKDDALELAFHSWVARCASENPDRVTDAAVEQCTGRHLDAALHALAPQVIVAFGGTTARFFWAHSGRGWDEWGPIERLHGITIGHQFDDRIVPVILSIHPYQRRLDLRPEVIGRALSEAFQPKDLRPTELRAA